jgi:hypothetical protein
MTIASSTTYAAASFITIRAFNHVLQPFDEPLDIFDAHRDPSVASLNLTQQAFDSPRQLDTELCSVYR